MIRCAIFFLLIATSAIAQTFSNNIHLGLNATQVDGDGFSGYHKIGLNFGLATHYNFQNSSNKLGFEINYTQKGTYQAFNPKRGKFDKYNLNLNYIEIPILYVFPKYGVNFEIGPAISTLISKYEAYNDIESTDTYQYNGLELGVIGGIIVPMTERIFFKIRLSNSITSIRDYGTRGTGRFWEVGSFHRMAGINFTYYFNNPKYSYGSTEE